MYLRLRSVENQLMGTNRTKLELVSCVSSQGLVYSSSPALAAGLVRSLTQFQGFMRPVLTRDDFLLFGRNLLKG
jgi:hypothetical protein